MIFQKNRFHFDRLQCFILKPEVIKSVQCLTKHISMNNLKIDIAAYATRPINSIWVHAALFYKYNGIVYNKFPIDVWENVCEFLEGKRENKLFLNWMLARVLPYTNYNHTCPYSSFTIKAENISLDKTFSFDKEILPSGRYRFDVSFTEKDRVPFFDLKIFGSNAEHYHDKI